ncbi:MAG: M20/M25/M40 family metallo-hydrolase [Desulfobacterales bacterium]|nr:M20/M25/M40 family metallo-hydrolase [Desulfobacterales bacterium]
MAESTLLIHKNIDPDYGFYIATKLTEFVNSDMGGRTAGSKAEHEAAEWLTHEMKRIGLSDVTKAPFPCDIWQFNRSTLNVIEPENIKKTIKPYPYPSGSTRSEAIDGELLFIGKGSKRDYENIDAHGKIVLIGIDMEKDWWITHPTVEAELQGAVAIISYCTGSYSQLNADTMNTQNFAGPRTIPSVNISKNDADYLKDLLNKGSVRINLTIDKLLESGGTSYNIIGTLPGKRDDEYVLCGDHYDCHFWGVQDNNAGVAMTLAIAKTMIDAGYQPERTIKFILHGAEEWGAIGTPYDFAVGGWHQVFTINPEWAGKSLAFINFEHPAHRFGDTFFANSTPEFYTFLQDRYTSAPDRGNLFKNGFADEGRHFSTDIDGWSYAISGIPVIVNGRAPLTGRNNYYEDIYHSNFDDVDTWENDIFLYNLKFYGGLLISLDKRPALPLDFSQQARRLKNSVNIDVFTQSDVDPDQFLSAIDKFEAASSQLYKTINGLNEEFIIAASNPDNSPEKMDGITSLAQTANQKILSTYKVIFDVFYKMDFNDDPIFAHEHPQRNILLLNGAIDALKNGNTAAAVENALERIDDNRLCRHFSKETLSRFKKNLSEATAAKRLYWAKDKIVTPLDLFEILNALSAKAKKGETDFSNEILALTTALEAQKNSFEAAVNAEREGLKQIMELL